MKAAEPSIGHIEASYNLGGIYRWALERFEEATKEEAILDAEFKRSKDPATGLKSLHAHGREMEAGVLLLMVTGVTARAGPSQLCRFSLRRRFV